MENNNSLTSSSSANSQFKFRNLHPKIFMGTASDRYAGWMDQIYTRARYEDRVTRRTKKVGKTNFQEATLPVESVTEYFEHFSVLEIDYTFYSLLRDPDGQPTKNFHVLKTYSEYISEKDRVVLKVPQAISAQKIRHGKSFIENDTYLDPEIFTKQFYQPAADILGPSLSGMIFEQEYQRKNERKPVQEMAAELDQFFDTIPNDTRYHVELRTGAYLGLPVFEVYEKHGIGQVLSHWTWLPRLKNQLATAEGKNFNAGRHRIIRLMTPHGMRYEDAYARAFPFDNLIQGMIQPEMIQDTVDIMRQGIEDNIETSIIINNRSGGNAPLIAEKIASAFLGRI
jgi:uncharacterized protein YecE (DUF72 family)